MPPSDATEVSLPLNPPAEVAGGLPQARRVWVRAAITRSTELRDAIEVSEWSLEPVLDSPALTLTLAFGDQRQALSFLLGPDDVQDLAAAMGYLR